MKSEKISQKKVDGDRAKLLRPTGVFARISAADKRSGVTSRNRSTSSENAGLSGDKRENGR
jgi:hypothetical protein